MGSWLVFHFLIQLLIPMGTLYLSTPFARHPENTKTSENLGVYSYLHVLKLYHNWGFFTKIKQKKTWFTVSTNDLDEQPSPDFFMNGALPQQFNYFQGRWTQMPFNLLTSLAGKHACIKLNLSDSISVNTYYSEFDLNSDSNQVVNKKITFQVKCKGLIKWGG